MADVTGHARIPYTSRLVAAAPGGLQPYLRLARFDRPAGTWLLLWPCWWSLILAGAEAWLFVLFALGALVMRAAGCVVNDIADRRIDGLVERTRDRPLASGALSVAQALAFLAVLLLAGLAVLVQLPANAVLLGALSLVPVAVYPLAKRFTDWPQALLGLTFNWGALLGWTAATGTLAAPALVLYGACIAWTLGYDTIYAHQDKRDDAAIGVRSSALALGARTRPWVAAFYALAWVGIAAAAELAGLGWAALAFLAPAAAHLAWQVLRLAIDDPARCHALFRSNVELGGIVAAGLLLARWV
ncbi:MAG: 4-hydroxybenzoate octaprenyltransferase [Alphaproteobacteria bacterium]|nr:4-hydroxybenzoate octaprenyltransferase [Alphaproteobacteria bacterium]